MPEPPKPMSAEEFLAQLGKGRRDFKGVDLYGARFDRLKTTLSIGALELDPATLRQDPLDLSGATLAYAFLENMHLPYTCFRRANLSRAQLHGAVFEHASLVEANCKEANLCLARFDHADFLRTRLDYANLAFASFNLPLNFASAQGLDSANLVYLNVPYEQREDFGRVVEGNQTRRVLFKG